MSAASRAAHKLREEMLVDRGVEHEVSAIIEAEYAPLVKAAQSTLEQYGHETECDHGVDPESCSLEELRSALAGVAGEKA